MQLWEILMTYAKKNDVIALEMWNNNNNMA